MFASHTTPNAGTFLAMAGVPTEARNQENHSQDLTRIDIAKYPRGENPTTRTPKAVSYHPHRPVFLTGSNSFILPIGDVVRLDIQEVVLRHGGCGLWHTRMAEAKECVGLIRVCRQRNGINYSFMYARLPDLKSEPGILCQRRVRNESLRTSESTPATATATTASIITTRINSNSPSSTNNS